METPWHDPRNETDRRLKRFAERTGGGDDLSVVVARLAAKKTI
jgi:hypothetical protein